MCPFVLLITVIISSIKRPTGSRRYSERYHPTTIIMMMCGPDIGECGGIMLVSAAQILLFEYITTVTHAETLLCMWKL